MGVLGEARADILPPVRVAPCLRELCTHELERWGEGLAPAELRELRQRFQT